MVDSFWPLLLAAITGTIPIALASFVSIVALGLITKFQAI